MDDRRARLKPVSETSVAWVWNTAFSDWLTGTDPFFWISGKPGSGKSTLLNCLSASHKTSQMLQADGNDWTTLEFYFDNNAGDAIANTIRGMLRTFLFTLIGKWPASGEYVQHKYGHSLRGNWLEHESELTSTLCAVVKSISVRICAFIDGVDEFNGKLRDLIVTLRDIQRRTGVKICLASRPDKLVSRMFASSPSLQVEDHNAATIESYIESACEELTEEEIQSSGPLWSLVKQEANGIILWARFVVDELVDRLFIGATMNELQDTLQTFPTEMEAVYERILRDLTEEQKLHAAIAFYIIEHGLTSLRSNHEVPTYDFFVAWTIMVERLSFGLKFDSGFDVKQFKIRIEAMLGGLLEFSSSETVRFVHATFESYLRRTGAFQSIIQTAIAPVFGDGLAGRLYLHLISQADEQIKLDLTKIDIGNIGADYSEPLNLQEVFTYLILNDPTEHVVHRLDFLLTAVGRLGHVLFDSPTQADSVWKVVNSSVFGLHQVLCSYSGCGCNLDFRSNSTLWGDRWCLQFLASHGLYFAFEYGIKQSRTRNSDAQLDMLEVTVDVVRKAQLELEQAVSMADMSKPKSSSFGLDGHRLIDQLLLQKDALNSSHLAICQIINFPVEPQFAARVRQFPLPTSFQASIPSTWFPYPSSNLLCCWAWCSDPCYNRHVQASRLQSLLDMGFDINAKAYLGGTVLHALFDYQEPVPISSHTRLHHVTWPFSSIKFDLIREAGFDFTSPLANDLLEHARKFQDDLTERTKWVRLRPEERKQINDLGSFIKNVLSPLCEVRFSRIWRIGTPPLFEQSPTRESSLSRLLPIARTASTVQRAKSRGSRDSVHSSYGPFLLSTSFDPKQDSKSLLSTSFDSRLDSRSPLSPPLLHVE